MSDFKDTVFLPKATVPVKAKVADELSILADWETNNLYQALRTKRKGRLPFILHDGPPYANGNIHIGHALNKILKDMVIRSRSLFNYDAPFVPGWDCHGLPIEWKVEEEWRAAKKDKNADPEAFKNDCRAYAQKWIDEQRKQFKRLGILADWDAHWSQGGPYTTMMHEAESAIVHAFHRLVAAGKVFREKRPTLWSPIERTALAEAETVEREHIVPNIWVKFKIFSGDLKGASLLVWTTTPWSLPGNVAVAFNPLIKYALYEVDGEQYVVADNTSSSVFGIKGKKVRDVEEREFNKLRVEHPLSALGFPIGELCVCEVIPAAFVKEGSGTGLVHVGPSHSFEDWLAWNSAKPGFTYPNPIMPNGVYSDSVPEFAGMSVTKGKKFGPANDAIVEALKAQGTLYRVEQSPLTVQHSWRSDAVLLTIASPQWFIDLDDAKSEALDSLAFVNMVPYSAKARMFNMIRDRPNWLVSRQRLWGTPLAIVMNKNTGEPCTDPNVLGVIHQTLMDAGTDEWHNMTVEDIFKHAGRDDADKFVKVDDILDVWFDSAQVQLLMGGKQADMVIEGTDQARGWFQASLLASVLDTVREVRPVPPYTNVLTHGFVLDKDGRKMAKSEGNVIDPLDLINKYGADALRVWVASVDWQSDVRVSMANMDNCAEVARKIRNTVRYMVAALHDYEPEEVAFIPELERYILHRMQKLDLGEEALSTLLKTNRFAAYMSKVMEFCQLISTLLFDVRKDTLYCAALDDPTRKAYRWALSFIFDRVVRWIAPIMPFAAEEMWKARYPLKDSVHLQTWIEPVDANFGHEAARWDSVLDMRSTILGELEEARKQGLIKSSAEAKVFIIAQKDSDAYKTLKSVDLAELTMVSEVEVAAQPSVDEVQIKVEITRARKCERCWRHVVVDDDPLCERCTEVVGVC